MSSCSLSGVAALLRVTVALPVKVATLPIGSSLAGSEGAGAACVAGACAGCTCAKTFAVPANIKQPQSPAANENRCIKTGSQGKQTSADVQLRARPAECHMNTNSQIGGARRAPFRFLSKPKRLCKPATAGTKKRPAAGMIQTAGRHENLVRKA